MDSHVRKRKITPPLFVFFNNIPVLLYRSCAILLRDYCRFLNLFIALRRLKFNCENTMKTRTLLLIVCWFVFFGAMRAGQPVRPESENYIKGVEALNDGDPVAAYKYLNAEITENPGNGYAHCYMALICNCCGDVKLALQALQSSLELIPETDTEYLSFAYYSRGVLLSGLNQWELAKPDLDKAIRLNPSDAENYKARAQLFLETARYEESLEDVQKALALDRKADVSDLVLRLMAEAPSTEFMERVSATFHMLDRAEVR